VNMSKPGPIISISNLQVERSGEAVLDGLSFDVAAGEIYALLGGNGAGKSTTLLTCLGLLRPKSGDVRIMGLDPVHDPAGVRRQVAYVSEQAVLYEHLTARENLHYFISLADQRVANSDIDHALDVVRLQSRARDQRMARFSKGMRQKVAIALALLRSTPVLLLDEPTSGLDPNAVVEFNRLVHALCDNGRAALMVTHDVFGACEVAARIGVLRNGRLASEFAADAAQHGTANRIDVSLVRGAFDPGSEA